MKLKPWQQQLVLALILVAILALAHTLVWLVLGPEPIPGRDL